MAEAPARFGLLIWARLPAALDRARVLRPDVSIVSWSRGAPNSVPGRVRGGAAALHVEVCRARA